MKYLFCQDQFYWLDSGLQSSSQFPFQGNIFKPVIYEKVFVMTLHQVFAFTAGKSCD
jgi:hypothetical protein